MTNNSTLTDLDIRVVVLVGGRDFGRCPLAMRLPAALWPIGDLPVLAHLLDHLADEGLSLATVCCPGDVLAEVESVCRDRRLAVRIVTEELTKGTGGCLRDAVSSDPGDLIVVLSGSMTAPPSIADLVEAHRSGDADLTVVFNPGGPDGTQPGPAAEIFLCRPKALDYIPSGGYSDIKEGVIPAILRAGGTVRPLVLQRQVGNFHDRQGYLDAVDILFQNGRLDDCSGKSREESAGGPIYRGVDVFTHPLARICGPVVLGDRARVLEGAVVIGPAVIGREAVLSESSAMIKSVLWAGAMVGRGGEVRESILDCRVVTPDGAQIVGRAVSAQASDSIPGSGSATSARGSRDGSIAAARSGLDRRVERLAGWMRLPPRQAALLLGGVAVLAALLWSYWPIIVDLWHIWQRSDEYSSGLLVPFLAAYVVWSRRQEIGSSEFRPAVFWGTAAFLFAQAVRGAGLLLMYQSAERLSLILSVVAMVLLLMGWRYLLRLAPVLLFLCLMFPWPNRVQAAMALPLQRWATGSAVFCLELAGWSVLREGNVIHIGDASVAVAEACNGLRMITAFFVISGLVVLLAHREWWAKLVVVVSSLPIALFCNTLRLAATSVFFTIIEGEVWEQRFHDYGGYAMMPLALAMVVGELWLLSRLTTPPTSVEPVIVSRRRSPHVPDPKIVGEQTYE